MNLDQIETKCFILALFIRDDGERFLLGSRAYEFKDSQLHFVGNMYQNDVVEVQGNDGVMLAGQVRRGNTQAFDGYIGDSTVDRQTIEQYRRDFMKFFRKNHYYKVVYVLPDGSAVQRRNGFIVEAPEVKELYQLFPEYHIGINFEDINYYIYEEDSEGEEIYGESATLKIVSSASGGLIWDENSEVSLSGEGVNFTLEGTVDGTVLSDIQLKGDTTQSGTPTPDYPQTVNIVTGRQVVTISDGGSQSQSYEVNLGKNLWDTTIVVGGIGSVGQSLSRTDRFGSSTKITVAPNTTYTFSATPKDSSKPLEVVFQAYDSNDTIIKQLPGDYFSRLPISFTTPSNCTKITISGRYWDDTNLGTVGDVTDAVQNPQLEKGSTATTYAPYFTPIELCKIGDYQDYIYKSGDDWYVHKATGKLSLNISDMDRTENYPGWNVANLRDTLGTNKNDGVGRYTSMYANICGAGVSGAWSIYVNTMYDNNILFLNKDYFGSDFTQTYWTTNYPNLVLDLYYGILTTPTDTQITNADLITQLNTLASATTYDGSTSFTVDGNGNLAAILAVEVEASGGGGVEWDNYGAVWEEGTGGGPTMIDVDSIDNVYPVWTVTGPAVNPQISVLTTNTTLSYSGTVTASQELKIDMFNKTATLNGASVVGNVSGDWVYLKPGVNRITYTTNNADAPDSTIWWQEIVG